ncbi:uncharacterized protein LOC144633330 isoform X2 [Oculina patagonica]
MFVPNVSLVNQIMELVSMSFFLASAMCAPSTHVHRVPIAAALGYRTDGGNDVCLYQRNDGLNLVTK